MPVDCPICRGTGFELTTQSNGVISAVRCTCDREQLNTRLLAAARIPKRYEHCTFDSFEIHDPSHDEALRAAREWCGLWPAVQHGLVFLGSPGTGKTHLAVAVARELIASKRARVLFHEQRALLKALQGTFESGSAHRESEILGPVLGAELLILDDLGAGRTTAWARDVMHDVIAQRYNEERPLILTSNHLTGDEPELSEPRGRSLDAPLTLKDRLGDALMSRLYEMCRVVRLQGKDYRSWILPHKHGY